MNPKTKREMHSGPGIIIISKSNPKEHLINRHCEGQGPVAIHHVAHGLLCRQAFGSRSQ
ncbi:MAG: hypothetical protein LBP52_02525 [Burkholderiaceae bacterium]|jgi:hypothetical protein|nr:hypothetical protein [Burkholderiaceae bacterium]